MLFPVFGYYKYNCTIFMYSFLVWTWIFIWYLIFSFISNYQWGWTSLHIFVGYSGFLFWEGPILLIFVIWLLPFSYCTEWAPYIFSIPILCQLYKIVYVDILVSIFSQSDVKFRDWQRISETWIWITDDGTEKFHLVNVIQGFPHWVRGDCCTPTLCSIAFASVKCQQCA